MIKKGILLLLLVGFVAIISSLLINFTGSNELNPLARYYVENGPNEVGTSNLVTAVVVTYRGFDTLGEGTILFITAAIVGFFLKALNADKDRPNRLRKTSEILETASALLVPTIFMLGGLHFCEWTPNTRRRFSGRCGYSHRRDDDYPCPPCFGL